MGFFYEECEQFDMKDMIEVRDLLQIFSAFTEDELVDMLLENGTSVYAKDRIVTYADGDVLFFGVEFDFENDYYVDDFLCSFIERNELDELKGKYCIAMGNIVTEHRSEVLIAEVASLKEDIANCNNEKVEIKIQLEDALKEISNAKKTKAFNEDTKEKWQGYLDTSVKLAAHCFAKLNDNDLPLKKQEIEQICASLGLEPLSRDAMTVFRNAMPEKYIKRQGRPSKE